MSVLRKLQNREKVFATMISGMTWPGIVTMLKKRSLDLIVFEMEHNHYDWGDLEGLLRAANMTGIDAVVRVTDIVYHQVSRVLDLGANGVLLPRIETPEQLEQAIGMVRLPPRGRKGVGGYDFAVDDLADKLARYNAEKMIIAQIESPAGIAHLDSMLATGEVAGAIVGPYDLSMSLGIPGRFDHPEFHRHVREVIAICTRRGISCGMYMNTPEDIRYWRGQGMNIIWSGSDLGFFAQGYHVLADVVDSLD